MAKYKFKKPGEKKDAPKSGMKQAPVSPKAMKRYGEKVVKRG